MKSKTKDGKINLMIFLSAVMLILAAATSGCGAEANGTRHSTEETDTKETMVEKAITQEKPYSEELEKRIAKELSEHKPGESRPDYLPAVMFSKLPEFPDDFYRVRTLVRLGRITDLGSLEQRYWMQPEFFPKFEDVGVSLLQNPPENRWGAYGIAVYPADSISTIVRGESLDIYFFIKSNYLVETYQGVNLEPVFLEESSIETGFSFPDGSTDVRQNVSEVKKNLDVKVSPNPFILEPNFPIYNINGTRKIVMTVTVAEDTPPGNYAIGLDTADVPLEYEKQWIREYLNLYTSGGMTKIERPYYQAFITVVEGEKG